MDPKILEETQAYRQALGCFATGVAVITAEATEGAWAITVNSFTSISLRPRLVLWSLGNDSDRYALFAGAPRWGVSVLGAEQEAVSGRFATHGAPPAREDEVDRLGGSPVLKAALSRFDCRTVERHHMGDHLVVVGEVERFESRPGAGLTYFRSRYGSLADPGL